MMSVNILESVLFLFLFFFQLCLPSQSISGGFLFIQEISYGLDVYNPAQILQEHSNLGILHWRHNWIAHLGMPLLEV